jgi:hypothetical protein
VESLVGHAQLSGVGDKHEPAVGAEGRAFGVWASSRLFDKNKGWFRRCQDILDFSLSAVPVNDAKWE